MNTSISFDSLLFFCSVCLHNPAADLITLRNLLGCSSLPVALYDEMALAPLDHPSGPRVHPFRSLNHKYSYLLKPGVFLKIESNILAKTSCYKTSSVSTA